MTREGKAICFLVPLLGILIGANLELAKPDTTEVYSVTVPIEVFADPVKRGACLWQLDTRCA